MRAERGFTLIELMIVIVIIGILAAIAIPKFSDVSKAVKEAEAEPILRMVYTLQERHRQAKDRYAAQFAELEGSAAPIENARHYTFRLEGGDTTFSACATPKHIPELRSIKIDQSRAVTVIPGGSCAGSEM